MRIRLFLFICIRALLQARKEKVSSHQLRLMQLTMNIKHAYCIIMAGGIGRRFWPYSRKNKPKQFLDLLGTGSTLLQQTYERYAEIIPADHIYISTHREHAEIALEQLPQCTADRILIEEERKNTAAAIAQASLHIKRIDPQATIIVAPSDHLILQTEKFKQAILDGLKFASQSDTLLTIGIKPHRPETGYGYIQKGEWQKDNFYKAKTFVEKPALEFAQLFIQSEEFYWNSGIFIWHVSSILNAFHRHMVDVQANPVDINDTTSWPNISIDYAILEKADNVYMQICDFGWADLGTWHSLYEASEKDAHRNVSPNANTLFYNSHGNTVLCPDGKTVILQDIDDCLITEQGNVLLVCKHNSQEKIRNILNDISIKNETHLE